MTWTFFFIETLDTSFWNCKEPIDCLAGIYFMFEVNTKRRDA